MTQVRVENLRPVAKNWTDDLPVAASSGWSRLSQYLLEGGRWKPRQVESLASESLRVLRHLPDPRNPEKFQGRGLVVGYVQSGKTANYTAVIARAVDAGYRLVIVLSGIHDALRNQTQARLEDELASEGGLRPWTLLTSRESDFREQPIGLLDRDDAFLIVAKKNVPVLKRLDAWLEQAGSRLDGLPVLLIDDEADQASINTRGNRPPDPSFDAGPVSSSAAGPGPTATNSLIRAILGRAPQATYVAYTATPFANIFIDPGAVDREFGEDLFPRDFALQLPRPEGYTGTEELFGVSAQGRDVFRRVPDEDVGALRQATRRRNAKPVIVRPEDRLLPDSLTDAIVAFCLAGAIREVRPDLVGRPHTMLVHVSVRVSDQTRVRTAIEDQRGLWLEAVRQGHDLTPLFLEGLETQFQNVDLPASPGALADAAISILERIDILELNSATGENLEYLEKPSRHLIAVGGNRLSRGLTLEGLTISYFLRTASMADTLLQMARWYGFRSGYEDLIRIWTTDGIAQWFAELALVEESLRDSLRALYRAGRRPFEMAIRLRAHSGLLLTARNKSAMADTQRLSWSGEHPQSIVLPLHDVGRLQANRVLADRLVSQSGPGREVVGGRLFQDLPPETICEFLRLYQSHPDAVVLRGDPLADWIMQRVAEGELIDWSIVLASAQKGAAVTIGGVKTQVVSRRRSSSESIGILIDPRHEGADLPGGSNAFVRESGSYDAEAMRSARAPTQGLLMVYPLDPEPLGVATVDAVIGIALSLPYTSDGRSSAVVNRGVAE